MAFDPIPHVVATAGEAADAPAGAIPIALFSDAPETTIADIAGLEARLTDIEDRIAALETPENPEV